MSFEDGLIDCPIISCMLETELRTLQYVIDMLLPQFTRFRMALESSKHWEDSRLIKLDAELVVVPFIVLIVNHHECGDFGEGECAKASLASPPKRRKFCSAARNCL